jgi:hypothetical protein
VNPRADFWWKTLDYSDAVSSAPVRCVDDGWVVIGHGLQYTPTLEDVGHKLRIEVLIADETAGTCRMMYLLCTV